MSSVEIHESPARGMVFATPLTGFLGATVHGVDIAKPLTNVQTLAVRDLLDRYKVLVFRDQHRVGPRQLQAFAGQFGEPDFEPHPTFPCVPEAPAVQVAESNVSLRGHLRDTWHTDGSNRQDPRCLTLLQAVDVPPFGRDTLFADMEAVYEDLSQPMKSFLETLSGRFDWGEHKRGAPTVEHPIVRRHPRTGRKCVFVNRLFTARILGVTQEESDLLLDFLLKRAHVPENQLRVSWTPGTIVLWDNERTQHYLVLDQKYARIMHRVVIV